MKAFALLCVALIAIPAAHAKSIKNVCDDPVTQYDMNMCANEDFTKADKRLNTAYNQLIKGLEPKQQNDLRQSQRGWIQYKESHCELEASWVEGGSMEGMLYDQCQTKLTESREKELIQLQKDFLEFGGI